MYALVLSAIGIRGSTSNSFRNGTAQVQNVFAFSLFCLAVGLGFSRCAEALASGQRLPGSEQRQAQSEARQLETQAWRAKFWAALCALVRRPLPDMAQKALEAGGYSSAASGGESDGEESSRRPSRLFLAPLTHTHMRALACDGASCHSSHGRTPGHRTTRGRTHNGNVI